MSRSCPRKSPESLNTAASPSTASEKELRSKLSTSEKPQEEQPRRRRRARELLRTSEGWQRCWSGVSTGQVMARGGGGSSPLPGRALRPGL